RHARRLDLPIREPARLERLEPVIAERHIGPAPGLSSHAPALLLAVFDFLRHQHEQKPLNCQMQIANCKIIFKIDLHSAICNFSTLSPEAFVGPSLGTLLLGPAVEPSARLCTTTP